MGGTLNTFNPLFPRGAYFGPKLTMFGPYNLFDVHPVLFFSPLENVTCDFDWGWFWRESLDDGLYQIGGALVPEPSNGSKARYIGGQPNFELRWALDLHTTIAIKSGGIYYRRLPQGHRPRGQRSFLQRRRDLQILNVFPPTGAKTGARAIIRIFSGSRKSLILIRWPVRVLTSVLDLPAPRINHVKTTKGSHSGIAPPHFESANSLEFSRFRRDRHTAPKSRLTPKQSHRVDGSQADAVHLFAMLSKRAIRHKARAPSD